MLVVALGHSPHPLGLSLLLGEFLADAPFPVLVVGERPGPGVCLVVAVPAAPVLARRDVAWGSANNGHCPPKTRHRLLLWLWLAVLLLVVLWALGQLEVVVALPPPPGHLPLGGR
jgi:hypothetical protein